MVSLACRPRLLGQSHRAFSTSTRHSVSLQWDRNDPEVLADVLPPYPHQTPRWYRQSRLGLYGGQTIRFGNNVSGPFDIKTRRAWRPNIFTRRVFSKALNRMVQVRVSTRVLRTIDKLGGLDEYLLGEKSARIKELGESGWWLRWAIMQTPAIKKRFAQQRRELGLPEKSEEVDEEEAIELEAGEEAFSETTPEAAAEFVALDTTEPVQLDDAFQIEASQDLPPIKFRVGPRKHIMLTSTGWHRTKPDPVRKQRKIVEQLAQSRYPKYVERQLQGFKRAMDRNLADKVAARLAKHETSKELAGQDPEKRKAILSKRGEIMAKNIALSPEQEERMIKDARDILAAELQARANTVHARRSTAKELRANQRRAEQKARDLALAKEKEEFSSLGGGVAKLAV